VTVEDIACVVKKVVGALPEETADDVRQETARILNRSRKPLDNLTVAFGLWKPMRSSLAFADNKCNSIMVLDTVDYNMKVPALLEDHTYRKLNKDSL
jgi:hypothetical protein